jgi:hypothetical protein
MPRVIQVIESDTHRGAGKDGDPHRIVVQYHTLDGTFLAERDTYNPEAATDFPRPMGAAAGSGSTPLAGQ